jgi:hypothetical protein
MTENNMNTKRKTSIELNKTFFHTITNLEFGNLNKEQINEIMKDGRPFSHFIEKWLETNYPLKHIICLDILYIKL